jgi:hypothetical protein
MTVTLLPPKTSTQVLMPLAGLSLASPGVVNGTKCNRKEENATDLIRNGIQVLMNLQLGALPYELCGHQRLN